PGRRHHGRAGPDRRAGAAEDVEPRGGLSVASGSRRVDAVVIGAGHNGLVAGAYLARAGLSTLILERSERVGGALLTSELAPGVRAPTLAHTVGRLRRSVIRDLELERHGFDLYQPEVRVFAP